LASSANFPSTAAGKMTFHLRGNGGNLAGSEWIAAEGEIVPETAADLENFIRSFGPSENPGGWSVRLNSPGGDLAGGIRLGELIRKLKLDTEIGATEPDSYGHWKRAPGHCASACAFAFLGGLTQYNPPPMRSGVRRFYALRADERVAMPGLLTPIATTTGRAAGA
jgi:hypothetical protein